MFQVLRRQPGFYKGVWNLSLPMILQNLITFSLGLIDTFMVSQLGQEEMAAVTTANVPVFLLLSVVFGTQSGLGILVSQYWGKKDMRSISRALGVACFLGMGITLVLALVFFFWPVEVMDLLSNRHDLSVLGAPYLRVIGFSYVFNMVSAVYVSAQRSVENPGFGMKLFGFSTILNTFLNYLLIFGKWGFPMLGVEGAAIATLCARISEFIICVVYALRSRRIVLHVPSFLHPGWEMLRRFWKYASPVLLSEILWGAGNSLLTVILGYTDNSVEFLAAYAVTGNLGRLFLVVCFGLGAATSVMVGKAIGEGERPEEVQSLAHCLLLFSVTVGLGLGLAACLLVPSVFEPLIFPIFKLRGEAVNIASALAYTAFLSEPLHAYTISAVVGVMRGGGDVTWAAVLDLAPQWLVALPLTALFALVFKLGYWPIAIAIQAESMVKIPLCIWHLRSTRWIHDVTLPEGSR